MNLSYLVSIISVLFCLFFFFYVKWYIKRRTSAVELLAEYRSEVYKLIAEIDASTDRDSQLVEDRIKKLKSILEETDKRINVYVRELDRSRTGEALYTSLGRGIRAALNTGDKSPGDKSPGENAPRESAQAPVLSSAPASSVLPAQSAQAPRLSIVKQQGESAAKRTVEPASMQSEPPAQNPPSAPKSQSKKQIRSQIEDLLNQGNSAADIASLLDISLSEVDLAINLLSRNKK